MIQSASILINLHQSVGIHGWQSVLWEMTKCWRIMVLHRYDLQARTSPAAGQLAESMDGLSTLFAKAHEWRDGRMAIATVIETWGSAPRPRGSHMLVHEDGRFEGSVSGGCVEGEILSAAAEVIESGQFQIRTFGLTDEDVWAVGIPCGGTISILVQPIGSHAFPPEMVDAIAVARAQGQKLAIATDLQTGRSAIGQDEGDFVNLYLPPRRLLIVGAVQISQSLVPIARQLGIAVTVIDPRGRFLTAERFPDVPLDDRWPDEAIAAHAPDPSTAVVVLSHDPKIDDPALTAALAAATGYIAALGSRRSHEKRRERLVALGLDSTQIDRIDAPAGIAIGALNPGEIALSIAAGMIKAFNGRD